MRALHTAFVFLIFLASAARLAPTQTTAEGKAASTSTEPFTIYLESFGGESTGNDDFLAAIAAHERLGTHETLLFDDLDVWPANEQVPAVTADSVQVAVLTQTAKGGPFIFHPATFFQWEDQVFGGALVAGSGARVAPLRAGAAAGAIGFWIFDDGNLRDSIYYITVTDVCGNVVDAVVENDTPRVSGYEVEGFFGVISQYGIAEVVITALNSATGEPWADPFELDYLTLAHLHHPMSCTSNDWHDDGDGGADTCHCKCHCPCGCPPRGRGNGPCGPGRSCEHRNDGCHCSADGCGGEAPGKSGR